MTSSKGQAVLEYAPTGFHLTSQMQNGSIEIIRAGNQVAEKVDIPGAPAGWRCRAAKSKDMPPVDPTMQEGTGTYHVSRGPDTVIDGTPVHTIISTRDHEDTIYVGPQNGLPKRLIIGGGARQAIDYYDYDAHIAITLPPCAP